MSRSSRSEPEGTRPFLQADRDASSLPTPDSPAASLSPDGMAGLSSTLNFTAEPNPPPPIPSHGVAQPSSSYGPVPSQQFSSRTVQGPRSTMQVLSTAVGEGNSSAAGDIGIILDDMSFGVGQTTALGTSSSSSSYPQLSNIMASRNPVSDGTQMFTPDRKIVSVKNLRGV